ncbi:MAG TPA: hypothetical protein VGP36_21030 [Mycobacteriales bacterium]|jgi:hypothetical protein|nr:hypothetical protein [Mycobacteriales bacterium]
MTGTAARAAGRAAQLWRVARQEGGTAVADRVLRAARARVARTDGDFPLLPGDVADSTAPAPRPVRRPVTGPLHLAWVTTPPAPGSGGHTTMFRMVRALEQAGHRCTLVLYDRWLGDPARQAEVIRAHWPYLAAEIVGIDAGVPADADGVVATSWPTAHVVATRAAVHPAERFYLVQDYEPYFYPHGTERVLAEDTYRFGFRGITAGPWLAETLASRFGMDCTAFPFGTDLDVYHYDNTGSRPAVVFYARPGTPRRAYGLGVLALEQFARRHPSTEIHLFGDRVTGLPFPATVHGTVSPAELNALYNRCVAGLSLSLTNVSLIPWELLAAGAVPVVNDAPHNRRVLDNPHVRWAPPTPHALADALSSVVSRGGSGAAEAAASVRGTDWGEPGRIVVEAITGTLSGVPR